MARAQSAAKDEQESPTLLSSSEKITYTPGPEGPMETMWMGHKFTAHVSRDLAVPESAVMDVFAKPVADWSKAEADRVGNLPRNLKTNAQLVTSARGNKFFHVGEFDPSQHGYKETITEPKTAEAYRAWAIGWMRNLTSVETACERWANEARMRAKLEVGFDDYKYISDFFQPVLAELIKREEEPRQVRDKITRDGEFADLFLQVNRVGEAAA